MNKTQLETPTIEQRHRTLLIIWFTLLMSLMLYLFVIRMMGVTPQENSKLTLILKLLGKAVTAQRVELVQPAYIVAFALCEVAALLAFADNRMTGSSYYYIGFAVGGLGLMLHFPRRQHFLDASGMHG